jgi:hypothetical protein
VWDKVKNGDVYRPIQPFTDVWRDFLQIKNQISLWLSRRHLIILEFCQKNDIDHSIPCIDMLFLIHYCDVQGWISHVLGDDLYGLGTGHTREITCHLQLFFH